MRHVIGAGVALALVCGTVPTAHAGGTFKGTFGPVVLKAKKRLVACSYSRFAGLFLVTGTQVKQHGRYQRGTNASGSAPDPSAPGAVFPLVLGDVTASFIDGPAPTPPLWTGSAALGNGLVLTLTGYKRGKVSGTLTGTLDPSPPNGGERITVDAAFNAKCTIL